MKRCMLLSVIVLAFGTTALADGVGVSYFSSSLNVVQWSGSSPLIPAVPMSPALIVMPGVILVSTASPGPILLHSVILGPTPSPYLGASLLSVAGHSAELGMLSAFGSNQASVLGGSVTLIGMQLAHISYP
jgi:hypothetical protein